jgi:hypothetical protein
MALWRDTASNLAAVPAAANITPKPADARRAPRPISRPQHRARRNAPKCANP